MIAFYRVALSGIAFYRKGTDGRLADCGSTVFTIAQRYVFLMKRGANGRTSSARGYSSSRQRQQGRSLSERKSLHRRELLHLQHEGLVPGEAD